MKTLRTVSGIPLILLLLFTGLPPVTVFPSSGTDTVYDRSQESIRRVWEMMKPGFSGTPFRAVPAVRWPFGTGTLLPDFVEDGLDMTNFVRYLAGLPRSVVLDRDLMVQAQHGAVLLASTDNFAHELKRPPVMSEEFYRQGLASTMSSNISRGFQDLSTAVMNGYMRDDDEYNLTTLGHRRWILNPQFIRTGFGYADGYHYGMTKPIGNSTMQVHDFSGPEIDYEFIAWPASGYFPREFFDSDDPWSITLNPGKYRNPDPETVSVTVTRLRDGRRWILNRNDSVINEEKEFFNINLERYGVGNAIIFRPIPSETGVPGSVNATGDLDIETGEYRIEIKGLKTAEGTPAFIAYTVNFFNLGFGGNLPQSPAREIASGG